jgi:hypothetical protein
VAVVYDTIPGSVVAFDMGKVIPGVIKVSDPDWPGQKPSPVMFSSVLWEQATNQQFQHSLDGSIYVYVFGDRMGKVVIEGFTFIVTCENSGETGLAMLMNFYSTNRASARSTPILIAVGEDTISGFLTGVTMSALGSGTGDDGLALVNRFTLVINALPKE